MKFKLLLIILSLFLFVGCRNTDSIMFKNEYETLNSNNNFVKVNIKSENPFLYITDEKLVEKITNKEEMVVLFGYSKSNETRKIIESLIKALNNLNINKIYYLDILDIRDEKEVSNDEIKVLSEGTNSYQKMIELLNEKLDDYIINNQVVGKRIYAPSILFIKNKEISIKSFNNDSEDMYKELYEFLKQYNNNSCSVESGC